jgi:hypothetical protein
MSDNFLYPDPKLSNPESSVPSEHSVEPVRAEQGSPEALSHTSELNAHTEALIQAARESISRTSETEHTHSETVETEPILPAEVAPEAVEPNTADQSKQYIKNLNQVFGGKPEQTKAILDASQMDVPALAGLITENLPPHAFEQVDPHNIVEALSSASEQKPDHLDGA